MNIFLRGSALAYIYLITNTINGKVYVGKTEDSIEHRFKEHICDSRKERCKNRPLYRAMNKYGVENFKVELIEETDIPEIREEYWIEYYNSYHNGYNATRGGDGKKYIDYTTILNTYLQCQNAVTTAKQLNVSVDTVRIVAKQNGVSLSSRDVNRMTNGKHIIMIDNVVGEMEFDTIADAANYLVSTNVTRSAVAGIRKQIRNCANGNKKTAYGKQWQWKQS
jgi:hypothetical protein